LKPLPPQFDLKKIETSVRSVWQIEEIRQKIEARDARPDGYVEGPPTMNGEPHIGHVRGRVIKDLWYRFNTLRGRKIVFRAGWDTQGLPVELQAEKELNLTGSKAENLKIVGEETLVKKCKEIIMKYNQEWRRADHLLGMSFDYDSAYWTYKDEYIEKEWKILEAAWKRGLLGEGYRVVAYCPGCQTSLSHAEVSSGYEEVDDPSVYYKAKLADEDAYLIIWTTMPFTLITDELVAVKPDASYSYVQVGEEIWIVGSDRLPDLMTELQIKDYKEVRRVTGAELKGRRYHYPFLDEVDEQRRLDANPLIHSIVAEDFVDVNTGSGLVHLSPANGVEDFDVASKMNLPIFAPFDDTATFTAEAGLFKGLFARDADKIVVQTLRKKDLLVKAGRLNHEYPLCWRSRHRLIWLARREYFYWVDRIGDLAVEAASKVEYFYEPPKNRFLEIVKEKVPWCISRERVWGTPLPIWRCTNCGEKIPAFSRKEIVSRAKNLPNESNFELHRPWIDKIVFTCEKCGADAYREPFVLDTWHNSGAAPISSFSESEYEQLVPVTFLTEAIDQTRGWAYTLLIEHVLYTNSATAPYRAFLFQGHVLDENGNKMSKSLGNVIDAVQVLSEHPVDLVRLYLMWKASPIDNLNFSLTELMGRPYQILSTLYHAHLYLVQNAIYDGFDLRQHGLEWARARGLLSPFDRAILSKLQNLISSVTHAFERCRFHEGLRALEEFIIGSISQSYIPTIRPETWDDREATRDRRWAIYATLATCLGSVDIMLHPVAPYVSEFLYSHLTGDSPVLLARWPSSEASLIDHGVESDMENVEKILSLVNAARMKGKVKRRWPLREACIVAPKHLRELIGRYEATLLDRGNLKKIRSVELRDAPITVSIHPRKDKVGARFKFRSGKVLEGLTKIDPLEAYGQVESKGNLRFELDGAEITLTTDEFEFRFDGRDGYVVAEKDGVIVALMAVRDSELIAEGIVRDVARRLQAMRKEKGYATTDILPKAVVASEDAEITSSLLKHREQLAYLVRVKDVEILPTPPQGATCSRVDIDKVPVFISI